MKTLIRAILAEKNIKPEKIILEIKYHFTSVK